MKTSELIAMLGNLLMVHGDKTIIIQGCMEADMIEVRYLNGETYFSVERDI